MLQLNTYRLVKDKFIYLVFLSFVNILSCVIPFQDSAKTEEFVDGVVLCRGKKCYLKHNFLYILFSRCFFVIAKGNYLSAVAEIGTFEHCLTTDLLNHLVFVQKVFMTEVNDVLNKVSGSDKPVPLWEDWPGDGHQHDDSSSALRMLLYNLIVRLKVSFFFHNLNF